MVQLLNYIDAIYSIRHPEFVNGTNITTTDMPSIHKAILSKAFDDGNRSALIFENELYYTIPISDLNNNVLKYFLLNNTTWDMMILSPHTDLTTTPVDGYANINLLTGNTFHADKIYLASRRLMAKAKNNNMSNIVTFYYSFNFINTPDTTEVGTYHLNIGKIKNVLITDMNHIKYTWQNFTI